jgi:hypothetical protein
MGLKITKEYSFSKVGVNEVKGLLPAMAVVVAPIVKHLKQSIYWDDNLGLKRHSVSIPTCVKNDIYLGSPTS